jgi:hypothetical protein
MMFCYKIFFPKIREFANSYLIYKNIFIHLLLKKTIEVNVKKFHIGCELV